jgi:predicted ribosome quality control (RQC) complex YloA/Tae2 family protein
MKVIEKNEEIYYIGENAKDNHDTFDKMSGTVSWFHLDDKSSAHVFVNIPKDRKLRKKIIKQAAYYVRYHSKDYGPVCYTSISNLQKGGELGEIIILDEDKLKVI